MTRHYEPIPVEELRDLARGQKDATVRRLLIEIRRLRVVESRASQLCDLYRAGYVRGDASYFLLVIQSLEAIRGDLPW
jgi:hypothetical protein